MNQLIIGLDEIVTAAQDKGENSGSAKISDLEWMLDDYKLIKDEMTLIVNETETQSNIDSFLYVDQHFAKTFESVKKSGLLVSESKLLDNNYTELNLGLSRILGVINAVINEDIEKINASVIEETC